MCRAVVREDAKKGFQVGTIWDDLVADHTLTQLLGEFHCDVAILQKEAISLVGEGELTFCHGFKE
jgi:hypothetical protein